MIKTIFFRTMQAIFVMFGISVISFLIFFATPSSDPAARIAGRNASPETLAEVRKDFGFDRPLVVQYAIMMKRLFITQDLTSFVNRGHKVVPQILEAAPITLSLVIGAAVIWIIGGIAMGTLAAAFEGSLLDKALMVLGLIGISMPVYWLGEIINLMAQSRLHGTWLFSWVPPLGYVPLSEDAWSWFKVLVLPWMTLAVLYVGLYGRILRAAIIDTSKEDFVRTARAKGISESRVVVVHSLRVSLAGVVAMFGLDFGALVGGGALLTEVVFNLHGIGKLTYDSLRTLDLPMIMATVLYAAFFIVMANFVVDVIYAMIDPRVRLE